MNPEKSRLCCVAAATVIIGIIKKRQTKKRRWWMRTFLKRRKVCGAHNALICELLIEDPSGHYHNVKSSSHILGEII